nr:SurA N-terminal domain-containing protein [Pseudomonadota bacterium]
MLQQIRDRATGWIAYIIIGLLIIPFALWGVNHYFGNSVEVQAAEVGDASISVQEFQRAYRQQRQRLQQLLGAQFDSDVIDEERLKQQVVQQLVNEKVLLQAVDEQGFRISDGQLLTSIQQYEAFQQDGAFDPALYERVLLSQGYSRTGFEQLQREALITGQLRHGLMATAIVTQEAVNQLAELLNQQRDIAYVTLPLEKYQQSVAAPDEAAVAGYFQENQARFQKPEQVRLHYLELKADELAENLPVSDDELQAAYDEQQARYVQEEQRSASHILVKIPQDAAPEGVDKAMARAQALYADIDAGRQTFDQALAAVQAQGDDSIEGGELGALSRGMLDPAFEAALFELQQPGQVHEPVRTPFGVHLIRLDAITPRQVQPLAEVRGEVAQELRRRKAEARFYDDLETLSNLAYEHPDSLEPAARALGLTVAETEAFSRQGGDGIAADPKVINAAFSDDVLEQGLNSEPVELGPNHVVFVRVAEHLPARPLSLDEAREDIVQTLRAAKAKEALEADLARLQERVRQQEPLPQLAEAFGGEHRAVGLVSRDAPGVDRAILEAAFRLPRPAQGGVSVGRAALADGSAAVIAVTQVVAGATDSLSGQEREALAQQLAAHIGRMQFEGVLD